jgi:UrcA family protein
MRIAILHRKSMAAAGISLLVLATTATEMRVSLGGLDMTTQAGVEVAKLRLKAAAQRLCRRLADDRKVSSWETYADCSRESFAMAVRQLGRDKRLANVDRSESPRVATND